MSNFSENMRRIQNLSDRSVVHVHDQEYDEALVNLQHIMTASREAIEQVVALIQLKKEVVISDMADQT